MNKVRVRVHGHAAPRANTATGQAVFERALELVDQKRKKLELSAEVSRQRRDELIEAISDPRLKRSAREG